MNIPEEKVAEIMMTAFERERRVMDRMFELAGYWIAAERRCWSLERRVTCLRLESAMGRKPSEKFWPAFIYSMTRGDIQDYFENLDGGMR